MKKTIVRWKNVKKKMLPPQSGFKWVEMTDKRKKKKLFDFVIDSIITEESKKNDRN